MNDEVQRWREKYLAGIEQQEALERRWDARFDLLRRGLVRSSLAAEGADKAVDQCMQDLREILRRGDMDGGLSALIPRLEKTVLGSEQRRQQRTEQVSQALSQLASQLLKQDLPREVRKPLKNYAKHIGDRAGHLRELPALLAELSRLQAQALAALGRERPDAPGLLARLFGSHEAVAVPAGPGISPPSVAQDVEPSPPAPVPTSQAAPLDDGPPSEPRLERAPPPHSAVSPLDSLPVPPDLLSRERLLPEPEIAQAQPVADPAYALPPIPEPGYSAIATHVEATLLGLLEALPLPERHQAQADLLRERIQAGLNMYELVPVLDDLAVLMLAVADIGQREFEGYLKQLNERLETFQGGLQTAHEDYANSMGVAREWDSELREQVDGLHSSVQQATDLDSLKSLVEHRLNGLLGTMEQYQHQRDERERAVVDRLQALVDRVASMEQEAKGFRQHLEEQRQKAMLDPLTGLPNRAAWSERLDLELARWQRYGGDLLLAVVDIDHFKRINDAYGHLAGDKVLKIIAGELNKRLRKTDFIARFGGEEFVLLIPATPLDDGLQLMETLRGAIEACPFHFKGEPVTITLSAGLSAFNMGEHSDQVFERADQALYRAKRDGRNRIECG